MTIVRTVKKTYRAKLRPDILPGETFESYRKDVGTPFNSNCLFCKRKFLDSDVIVYVMINDDGIALICTECAEEYADKPDAVVEV